MHLALRNKDYSILYIQKTTFIGGFFIVVSIHMKIDRLHPNCGDNAADYAEYNDGRGNERQHARRERFAYHEQ